MSKRDYIDEILAKKQRSIHDWQDSSYKLFELEHNFDKIKNSEEINNSQYSLFLVGIVTCLEIATRKAIQRLVDQGTPYFERIDKFKDFLRIDLNVTKALHDRKVSFGELVSHLLPINNVENIMSHLGVLLDFSFSELLKNLKHFEEPDLSQYFEDKENKSEKDKTKEQEKEQPGLIIDDVNDLISHLNQMFIKRHIIVHEGDFETVSTKEELEKYFLTANNFINAIEEMIEQLINPNMSRNAFGISLIEAEEAGKISEEMEKLYKEIYRETQNEETYLGITAKRALEFSQKAFNQYLEAEMAFEEALVNPMSGNTLRSIKASVIKTLCNQRIERFKDLKDWYIDFDKD